MPSGLKPITDVTAFGGLTEVGDTLDAMAEGFNAGQGIGVEPPHVVSFSATDLTVVALETTTWVSPVVAVRVRGLKPGTVGLSATINGVTGQTTVLVIPVVQSVVMSPSPITVHVNGVVTVTVVVTAMDGSVITTVDPSVSEDDPTIAFPTAHNQFRGAKVGATTLRAGAGRVSAATTFTVIP